MKHENLRWVGGEMTGIRRMHLNGGSMILKRFYASVISQPEHC